MSKKKQRKTIPSKWIEYWNSLSISEVQATLALYKSGKTTHTRATEVRCVSELKFILAKKLLTGDEDETPTTEADSSGLWF